MDPINTDMKVYIMTNGNFIIHKAPFSDFLFLFSASC